MYVENIKVGSDPELFIINKKTNKVVSSIGLIPGVKGNAYRAPDMPEGYGLQIDNILAEFNIPPTNDRDEFLNSINYMKNYIREYVQNINPDLDILCTASMDVDEDQLQSEEAKLFGCSVDYNAYTEEENPKPKGDSTNMRSAGVHIHLSYDNPNVQTSLLLIKYMDMYLGIPSVLLDPDTRRRTLYGKAGDFRLKAYGVEYRSLSSYMMSSPEMLSFVWNGIQKAISAYNHNVPLIDSTVVQSIINNSDVELAKILISSFNLI
jgi:hypothetical protein